MPAFAGSASEDWSSRDFAEPAELAQLEALVDDEPSLDTKTPGVGTCHLEATSPLAWADVSRAALSIPTAADGQWWVEVRSHALNHEARWTQGPFEAASSAGVEVILTPPSDATIAASPADPVLVTVRLVLRSTAGTVIGQTVLPRLAMQEQESGMVFRSVSDLDITLHVSDSGEEFASTDLPSSL